MSIPDVEYRIFPDVFRRVGTTLCILSGAGYVAQVLPIGYALVLLVIPKNTHKIRDAQPRMESKTRRFVM